MEDDDHRRDIDNASDLLMEVGTDGAGIAGMGSVVILGGHRQRGVLGSGIGFVDLLMERLMPGRIRRKDPKQDQKQRAHDSAKNGTPTRQVTYSACVQSICIKGIQWRALNQNLQNEPKKILEPTVSVAPAHPGKGGVFVSEAESRRVRPGRSERHDELAGAHVRTVVTTGCGWTSHPAHRNRLFRIPPLPCRRG